MESQSYNIAYIPVVEQYNQLLLDIGSTLLASGANCGRINSNVTRFANALGIDAEIFYSYSGLILTTKLKNNPVNSATHYKRVAAHGVHFGILTEVSLLSWRAKNEALSYEEIKESFEHIKKIPHHPEWMILLLVGVACAGICLISKGNWVDGLFTFMASVAGLFVRFRLNKNKFNPMIGFVAASFVTTLIASIDVVNHLGSSPEKALATAVLYLIPGVPLLNCVMDLIEGYIPTAIARGVLGGFILLCIAIGMSLSILLIGLNNY